ncbi:hypothetical protein [Neobacillus cucumis]|uniref:Uncharacterized protein n=1 Tax=Neobacillus cucumis TaxID=1740721 RepID=A0A2N5HBE9_9BACI|nr:hypothetical protein [Neobacillus cucumis]PLS02847.1 hypothetical protein CVD27_16785 [Neobacillus cucumis]
MNSKQQDTIQFYKQIEAEINKRIHASTNSRAFTAAVGKAMDSHLRELRISKRLTTRWLNRMNLPTKDEFAALSNRIVEIEEEIDSLDESIYQTINLQKTNQRKLRMVRELLEEWSDFLKSETQAKLSSNIQTLEKDLQELKQLFEMDFTKEEEDNGRK